MLALFNEVVGDELDTHRRDYDGKKKKRPEVSCMLSTDLAIKLNKYAETLPPVTLTVKVSQRDLRKIKDEVAGSCMTEKTKSSVAAALKGKV